MIRALVQTTPNTNYGPLLREKLRGADEIVLAPPADGHGPEIWGAVISDVYAALRDEKHNVKLARCQADADEHICRAWTTGDVTRRIRTVRDTLLTDQTTANPVPALVSAPPPERHVWIGRGTNTWRSDLTLAIRFERTAGPADLPGSTLGIPWMAGIPGSIGGWIAMNAGAFGHSISEALDAVRIDGIWRNAADCGFGYRKSAIHGEIQDFRLKPRAEIKSEGSAAWYLARRKRFPAGTFGSFFKNPDGDFAGRILEAAGAKDFRIGGATVWHEHANVIVASKDATPSDVLALAWKMTAAAHRTAAVTLEPEVRGITAY